MRKKPYKGRCRIKQVKDKTAESLNQKVSAVSIYTKLKPKNPEQIIVNTFLFDFNLLMCAAI